jgi:hypothetical protein
VGGAVAGRHPEPFARHLAGQQVAALDLEQRVQQALERRPVDARPRDLLEAPADRGLGDGAAGAVVEELDRDVGEAQRGTDRLAHRLQDRPDGERLGQPDGHGEEMLERGAVAVGLGRGDRVLERLGDVRAERRQDVELVVGGAAPGHGLVDGQHAEQLAAAVEQGDEERVGGVPQRGVVRAWQLRDVAGRVVGVPVELAVAQEAAALALEGRGQQRRPLLARRARAEQRGARLLGAVHRRGAQLVPGGLVHVDHDAAKPERLGGGGGQRREQRFEVIAGADQARDLEQAGEPGERDAMGVETGRRRRLHRL